MVKVITNFILLFKHNQIANRFANILSVDVLVKGASVFLIPVYLHLMSQEQIGIYNYIFSFIQLMAMNLNFGVYIAQSKLYHDFEGDKRRILLFSINFILIVLLFLFLFPAYYLKWDVSLAGLIFEKGFIYENYRWPILFAILETVGAYILFNYLLTSEQIKRIQLFNLIRLLVSNIGIILLLYYTASDKVFVRISAFYLFEFLVYLCFIGNYIRQFKICFDQDILKRIIYFSLPTFLLTVVSTIYSFSDKYFIQERTNMSVLAIYTLSITIASLCGLMLQSFQSIWLPIFFKEKDIEKNFRITRKMVFIIVVVFALLSVLLILCTKIALVLNIIPVVYEKVVYILPFLFLSQIINGVNMMYSNYFSYFNKVYLGALIGGIIYIVSFILNYLFIPRFGVTGAIISLLIGNVLLVTVVYFVIVFLYKKSKNGLKVSSGL